MLRGAVYPRSVTSTVDRRQPGEAESPSADRSRLLRLLRSSAGIAIAMAVMNVGTYAFQMVAARLLGPSQYGAVAGMMALLMVLSVVQLGLQATAARRIAAAPEDVAAIEQTILTTTWRAAFVLGALALAASPAVWWLLRLDGLLPAVLLGAVRGAGDGHGRPGGRPPGRATVAAAEPRLPVRRRPAGAARRRLPRRLGDRGERDGRRTRRLLAARPHRQLGAPQPRARRDRHRARPRGPPRRTPRDLRQLRGAARVRRALEPRHRRRPQRARRPPGRSVCRRPDRHQGRAVPAAVRRRDPLPVHVDGRREPDRTCCAVWPS